MRDYEDPVHVPPLALKIFTAGLITFFIITPIIIALRTGYIGNLVAGLSLGLAAVGLVIGGMFIQRLILWFIFAFYWYIAACIGVGLLMLSLAIMGNFVTMPTLPSAANASPLMNIGMIGGIALGLGALYLIFRRGGINQSVVVQPAVPVTPPPAPTPQKRILDTAQQIASRKHDLGIDDKGKSN